MARAKRGYISEERFWPHTTNNGGRRAFEKPMTTDAMRVSTAQRCCAHVQQQVRARSKNSDWVLEDPNTGLAEQNATTNTKHKHKPTQKQAQEGVQLHKRVFRRRGSQNVGKTPHTEHLPTHAHAALKVGEQPHHTLGHQERRGGVGDERPGKPLGDELVGRQTSALRTSTL